MTKQEKQRVARTNECNETIYDMRYGLNSNKTNKYNLIFFPRHQHKIKKLQHVLPFPSPSVVSFLSEFSFSLSWTRSSLPDKQRSTYNNIFDTVNSFINMKISHIQEVYQKVENLHHIWTEVLSTETSYSSSRDFAAWANCRDLY